MSHEKKLFSALSVSLFHALGNTFRWSMQEKKMPTFTKDMHDIARASEWAQPNAGTTSTIFLSLILARTYKHNNGIYIHIHIHTHTQLIHSYDIFWIEMHASDESNQSFFFFSISGVLLLPWNTTTVAIDFWLLAAFSSFPSVEERHRDREETGTPPAFSLSLSRSCRVVYFHASTKDLFIPILNELLQFCITWDWRSVKHSGIVFPSENYTLHEWLNFSQPSHHFAKR